MKNFGNLDAEHLAHIRKAAEFKIQQEDVDYPPASIPLSQDEIRCQIQELRTHQIELEMQNDELRRIQEELYESKTRYSNLYNYAPVGFATLSTKGHILKANLTLAEMLDTPVLSLVTQPFTQFIVPDDQDIFYLCTQRVLKSRFQQTCQLRLKNKGDAPIWVELESMWIDTNKGNQPQLRTVVSDITLRKQAELEKMELERQILHCQKLESLGVLAGGIAHDFNNLLTVICSHTDLALDSLSKGAPVQDFLHGINAATSQAKGLTRQMLDYSGRGKSTVAPVDIEHLVKEMAQLLKVSISKQSKLQFNFAKNLPSFSGDATQVGQVIMNLIINASEAQGEAGGGITLSSGLIECDQAYLQSWNDDAGDCWCESGKEGTYVYVDVTDDGCGMSADTVRNIFNPFFSTKVEGRGLGMSVILGIVRGHQGMIKIHTEANKGTTFRVLFPVSI